MMKKGSSGMYMRYSQKLSLAKTEVKRVGKIEEKRVSKTQERNTIYNCLRVDG